MNPVFFIGALALLQAEATEEPVSDYEACAELATTSPDAAARFAEQWMSDGGGIEAKHCAAIAMLAQGAPRSAGALLIDLAESKEANPVLASQLYVQAAEALLSGGAKEKAFEAVRSAYRLMPDAPEIHVAAAAIYATAEEWEGVKLTLTALERQAALSADAYALRGRAHFELGDHQAATEDVVRALELEPLLVDALVLRGDLLTAGYPVDRE